MSCEHPFKAYYTGNKTDNGKDELLVLKNEYGGDLDLSFVSKRGLCVDVHNRGFVVLGSDGRFKLIKHIDVPCGKCLSCRMDHAKEWSTRLSLESLYWSNSYFITLTYSDDCVGSYCLQKREAQLFLKRLKKAHPDSSYFLCGEYGSRTLRPHYHMIFFTNDDLELGDRIAKNRWTSPEISRLWSIYDRKTKTSRELGLIELSFANPACMGYVAQYCQDKVSKEDPLGRPPKFLLMSKKPAIGFRYLKDNEFRFRFFDIICYGPGGLVANIPKSFVRKLDFQPLKDYRALVAKRSENDFKSKYITPFKDVAGFVQRQSKEIELDKHRRNDI